MVIVLWLAVIATATISHGAVVVFDNRMRESVSFELTAMRKPTGDVQSKRPQWKPYGKPLQYNLASGEVLPIPVLGTVRVAFGTRQPRQYMLDPNTVCYFGLLDGVLDLQQIGFTDEEEFAATASTSASRSLHATAIATAKQEQRWRAIAECPTAVIPVKVLVDDNEVARTELWHRRLSDRLEAASKIFEQHARIRFQVVAFDTWQSNDAINKFSSSLSELEREVPVAPARLAIGFTSQYKQPQGTTRLGGTFGPFRSHILIREWHNHISEAERTEVLVHELGHYFGATHSLEPTSVMRPKLGDRQSRKQGFRIRFDPLNTLILYLVGEEIRYRGIDRLSEVSPETKQILRNIYAELTRGFPEDNAAPRMLRFLSAPSGRLLSPTHGTAGAVRDTR